MTIARKTKVFVLDTNVILHDSRCMYAFGANDVVIPVTVLEELDSFKKGNESVNFHAREFLRKLDALSGDQMFGAGLKLEPSGGRIRLVLERPFHADLAEALSRQKSDHHILNTAYLLAREEPDRTVILVTKDVNLRMKAKAFGLMAQDYRTDAVRDVSTLYTGKRVIEHVDAALIELMYNEPFEMPVSALTLDTPLRPHENLILKNGRKSALATFDQERAIVRRVNKRDAYGITPRNAEQAFAVDALLNDAIPLVSLSGTAGSGKTLLALAAALECRKRYMQVYLARPVVPLSNKDIGFLPGEVKAKLEPYMQPLYDNLAVIQRATASADRKSNPIQQMLDQDKLTIAPLTYIRGRSLNHIFFIVDEAQNLTPHEIKTIITRAGEGTKVVLTGDIYQIDHPYLDTLTNGLSYLIEKMQGQKLYAHINLEKGERSELADLASNVL